MNTFLTFYSNTIIMKNINLSVQLTEADSRRFIKIKREYEDLHDGSISNAELVRVFIGIVESHLRTVKEATYLD